MSDSCDVIVIGSGAGGGTWRAQDVFVDGLYISTDT